jgi:hypothetical protein
VLSAQRKPNKASPSISFDPDFQVRPPETLSFTTLLWCTYKEQDISKYINGDAASDNLVWGMSVECHGVFVNAG